MRAVESCHVTTTASNRRPAGTCRACRQAHGLREIAGCGCHRSYLRNKLGGTASARKPQGTNAVRNPCLASSFAAASARPPTQQTSKIVWFADFARTSDLFARTAATNASSVIIRASPSGMVESKPSKTCFRLSRNSSEQSPAILTSITGPEFEARNDSSFCAGTGNDRAAFCAFTKLLQRIAYDKRAAPQERILITIATPDGSWKKAPSRKTVDQSSITRNSQAYCFFAACPPPLLTLVQ